MTLYYAKDRIEKTIGLHTNLDYNIATPGKIKPGTTYELILVEFTIYCVRGDVRFEIKEVLEINGDGFVVERNREKIINIIQLIKAKLGDLDENDT